MIRPVAPPGRKILVVDDDPWIAKMLEFVATDAGHRAIVCKDGADAIEKFAEVMPDLVLLDVVLPKLDGLKVCDHIKKTPIGRLTPVLVFSGIYRDSTEAAKFGADAFIAKPFSPQQIALHLKQMLPLQPQLQPQDLTAPPLKPGQGETLLSVEPLPRTLGRLHQGLLTGVLTVRSRIGIKYLFIEKGQVVQVRSPSTASGVTTALLARGRVTPLQLEKQEQAARESQGKKTLSQLLVESGLVRPDELRKLVLGQMLWEIFEVMRWRDGVHAFAESPPLPQSAGQFKLDVITPNLVHWGVRKMEPSLADLDALVQSRMAPLLRTPDADKLLAPLLLTERDKGILALIDPKHGTKTVQEVLGIAELAGYDATPTLYTLLSLGALAAQQHGGPQAPVAKVAGEARALGGPFAMALMELWRGRETGLVRCKSSLDNRVVYVAQGRPIFARSERNADRLDQLLVRAGTITPEQAARSLELQARAPQKRVGQILIEMGAIQLEQLHATVKLQVQNHILSLFTWAEGEYRFEPGALPTQEAITLDWDTPGAVLQGLRGLPLNYIKPLAPPKDAIVERNQDDAILRELQLNSAEQKLLALLVGRHPMEQLLALDFISHEALIRGLVTFAALGLLVVHRSKVDSIHLEPEGDAGIVIDPFAGEEPLPPEPEARAPAPQRSRHVTSTLEVSQPIIPPWPGEAQQGHAEAHATHPDTVAPAETSAPRPRPPPPVAPPRKGPRFAGPALAAFESEHAAAATDSVTDEPAPEMPADLDAQAQHFSSLLSNPDESAATEQGTTEQPAPFQEAELEDAVYPVPQSVAEAPGQRTINRLPPAGDQVPRALYDQLLQDKHDLQQRLIAVLDERSGGSRVPRELFDQVQEEKRLLQEKMMMMLDELLKLRSTPTAAERARLRPFPGRKGEGK